MSEKMHEELEKLTEKWLTDQPRSVRAIARSWFINGWQAAEEALKEK